MSVALALPIAAGAAGAGQALIWATVALGSIAHVANEFRPEAALPFPRVTGLEGLATLQEMIEDMIHGARLPVGFPENPRPPDVPQWLFALMAGAAVKDQIENIWNWLNRPKPPQTVGSWPGAVAGSQVTFTKSPRLTNYTCSVSMVAANWQGEWVPVPFSVNAWEAGSAWRGMSGVSLSVVAKAEGTDKQGRQVGAAYVRLDGKHPDGAAVWSEVSQRMHYCGSLTVRIRPTEADTTGWVTESSVQDFIGPRPEALPEREPAKAPPLAWPAAPPAPTPAAPSEMPLPPWIKEDLGEDGKKPIWEWPPGVGTGIKPKPSTGTGTAPAEKPATPPVYVPVFIPGPTPSNPQQTNPDGSVKPRPNKPITITNPDSHFVGGSEIAGSPARVSLASIAREVTRIEQKLANLSKPSGAVPDASNWLDELFELFQIARQIHDALTADVGEATWRVTAPCNKDAEGKNEWIEWKMPKEDYLPAVIRRLEILMAFHGDTLGWRRPICKQGNPANVQIFAYGVEPAPTGNGWKQQRALEKRLSYRLPIKAGEEEARLQQTALHWAGFSWEAGRTIVEWNSPRHGVIQVWASSAPEGMGVIRWALSDMGVAEGDGDWLEYESKSRRNGRSGTVVAGSATVRVGESGKEHRVEFWEAPATIERQDMG